MNADQRALQFNCQGSAMVGVIDVPERPLARGLLMLAGAAQYRIGHHRHFALLARMLAGRGIPVMRFDHRGMGDSEGDSIGASPGAQGQDDDIRSAMKEFFIQMPEMKEIVIWGLGDAAATAALYAQSEPRDPRDPRVSGVIILNPDLPGAPPGGRGEPATRVPALLARFGELGFWKRVAGNGHAAGPSATVDRAGTAPLAAPAPGSADAARRGAMRAMVADPDLPLGQRMLASLASFDGAALVILGGDDPAARDFAELLKRSDARCKCVTIAGANHTFVSREWRADVAETCANWIVSW